MFSTGQLPPLYDEISHLINNAAPFNTGLLTILAMELGFNNSDISHLPSIIADLQGLSPQCVTSAVPYMGYIMHVYGLQIKADKRLGSRTFVTITLPEPTFIEPHAALGRIMELHDSHLTPTLGAVFKGYRNSAYLGEQNITAELKSGSYGKNRGDIGLALASTGLSAYALWNPSRRRLTWVAPDMLTNPLGVINPLLTLTALDYSCQRQYH